MSRMLKSSRGFTLIELVVIIVVLAILAAVAIPKLFKVTEEAEKASVASMVSNLESAMSIYVAKQFVEGESIQLQNPFDLLSNTPTNYEGGNDPITTVNTPDGSWSWRATGNWVMYNPKTAISGGWVNGGERFIIYQVQPVVDGADTVGLKLNTTPAYAYEW